MAEGGNAKTNTSYKGHLKNKQDSVRPSDCLCSLQKGSKVYVDLFCRLTNDIKNWGIRKVMFLFCFFFVIINYLLNLSSYLYMCLFFFLRCSDSFVAFEF